MQEGDAGGVCVCVFVCVCERERERERERVACMCVLPDCTTPNRSRDGAGFSRLQLGDRAGSTGPGPKRHAPSVCCWHVRARSRHGHGGHSTVTARSRHGHGTVTSPPPRGFARMDAHAHFPPFSDSIFILESRDADSASLEPRSCCRTADGSDRGPVQGYGLYGPNTAVTGVCSESIVCVCVRARVCECVCARACVGERACVRVCA